MKEEFIKDVGLNLKQIRKENKVSADTIAEYLGITESSYYYIESGKTELKVSRLKLISECLDVPMAVILGESSQVVSMIYSLREEMREFNNKQDESK